MMHSSSCTSGTSQFLSGSELFHEDSPLVLNFSLVAEFWPLVSHTREFVGTSLWHHGSKWGANSLRLPRTLLPNISNTHKALRRLHHTLTFLALAQHHWSGLDTLLAMAETCHENTPSKQTVQEQTAMAR